MTDRLTNPLRSASTRTRLVVGIALIVVVALAVSFVAVYRGTGSQLRQQVDGDLSEDAAGLAQHVTPSAGAKPAEISRQAQRYINSQPTFGPSAGLLVVKVDGAKPATNEPELLNVGSEPGEPAAEQGAETKESRAILTAPIGYSTVQVADVGEVRLLTRPLLTESPAAGRITVGESLSSVQDAQSGVSRAFLLAGALALIAALLAGVILAARTTRPTRRMATVAGAVDAGDLSMRMEPEGAIEAR